MTGSMDWDRNHRVHNHRDEREDEPEPNRECDQEPESRDKQGFIFVKLITGITINITFLSVFLFIRFYHPDKPKFILQDATVFAFNLSTDPPNFLNSTLQFTIASQNPNGISGIYYDGLDIYAEYKNQQITYQTDIPRLYQGHKETNVWSLMVNGTDVPVAPYNVHFLTLDQSNGIITLQIKLQGHVRWRMCLYTTRKHHIHVLCNAIIGFTDNPVTNSFSPFINVKYLIYRKCKVTV